MAKTKNPARMSKVAPAKKVAGVKTSKSAVKKIPVSNNRKVMENHLARSIAKKGDEKLIPEKGVVSAAGSKIDPLDRAEKGLNAAIEALNNQMIVAIEAVTQIVKTRGDGGNAVVRTAPIDRATSMFRRLIGEVVDNQLAEILPPLVVLRNEMAGHPSDSGTGDLANELRTRVIETLDHVFALAGVQPYEARIGESFDSLIHLAVGETHRGDLADGAIAEQYQPGFRFVNGKLISPAKVCINRR
jgi:hypothetical protein